MDNYQKLIQRLIKEGYLITPEIINAFKDTPRIGFLPERHKSYDSLNAPLPLQHGQTTSQPLTIAFMIELLKPRAGNKILEIGYGSGWQTAILAKIACPNPKSSNKSCGKVYAYEIVPQIADFGERKLEENLPADLRKKIHLYKHDFSKNLDENKLYDRIISGAAFKERPTDLIKSLSIGGIMVFPSQARDIRRVERTGEDEYIEETYPGFVFVPVTH
ncbi:protein-L-isoaspartate O-methyltransferase [Candidatus Dojkabacteria bacterium]|nr:protein-L-isoaspartate O-methyltransferase [Candidatus Dojkabacteria bacterium]